MTDKPNRGLSLMNRVRLEQQAKAIEKAGAKRGRAVASGRVDPFQELKERIHEEIIQEIDPTILDSKDNTDIVKQTVQNMVIDKLAEEETPLSRADRETILQDLMDEVLGYGPIQTYLDDDTVTEVMVNGPDQVYIEQRGKLVVTDKMFHDDNHVLRIIEKIVAPLGRRIDESTPMVDARLPDGSRVNAIIPPLSLVGPSVTIRKFSRDPYSVEDLIAFGTFTKEMADFLDACVKARLNIVVSGGTGSGKTTTLNVLSSFIPDTDRIVTIEDAAELQLRQEHVVSLESRPPNIEGKGQVTIRDLVKNSLRMRPDRIVVGECRAGEALDMLQAMNTGHDGSLTTGHANSPRDIISRLETMVLMAGMDLPVRAIREQMASALDLIVHEARLRDGTRKITFITEVVGMEQDKITLQDIFIYKQTGIDSEGMVKGYHMPTGIIPKFVEQFDSQGIEMPRDLFFPKDGIKM
jgi:pilus assembly protein CpaF